MRQVEIRLAAQADLAERYQWLDREAGTSIADAMLDAATAAFDRLAEVPGLGSPEETRRAELWGLRKWPVPGFARLRIFYQADDDTLFVVRVLHTAQDRLAEIGDG